MDSPYSYNCLELFADAKLAKLYSFDDVLEKIYGNQNIIVGQKKIFNTMRTLSDVMNPSGKPALEKIPVHVRSDKYSLSTFLTGADDDLVENSKFFVPRRLSYELSDMFSYENQAVEIVPVVPELSLSQNF